MHQARSITSSIWAGIGVALITAAVIASLIMRYWHDWLAVIVLIYAIYFMGGFLWLSHRRLLGSSFSVGMLLGLLAPLALWLINIRP